MTGIDLLPWDTSFFGSRIGRTVWGDASLDELIALARAERVECLYLVVPEAEASLVGSAVDRGARLVAMRSELALDRFERGTATAEVRFATDADQRRVVAAGEGLAGTSRFAADPRFAVERVEEMYRIWALQCLYEGVAVVPVDEVVALVGGRDRGGTRHIELVYVEPDASGRGLGRALLVEALRDAVTAIVATQGGNVAALGLYESVGFRTTSVEAILHLWLDEVV